MPTPIEPLILDLLEWIARQPRTHAEVMDAWRTSCPHLPVWEDAEERGFVAREHDPDRGTIVSVTPKGRAFIDRRRGPGVGGTP